MMKRPFVSSEERRFLKEDCWEEEAVFGEVLIGEVKLQRQASMTGHLLVMMPFWCPLLVR